MKRKKSLNVVFAIRADLKTLFFFEKAHFFWLLAIRETVVILMDVSVPWPPAMGLSVIVGVLMVL